MTIPNRADIYARLQKVLSKHYKPISVDGDRPLLENLIFAGCLENAHYDVAIAAYQRLAESFYDWNEVRVASVAELAEVFKGLPDPARAGQQVKRTIQAVFESNYRFDLESMKKQNIGKTVSELAKYDGVTGFAVAFVTQHSLGGHSIPIDDGALQVLYIVGAITEHELAQRSVPGLERAIPKKAGLSFSSLLHEAGADIVASPYASPARAILCDVSPDAKSRLPKRASRKKQPPSKPEPPAAKTKKAKVDKGLKGKPSKSKTEKTPSKSSATGKGSREGASTKSSAGTRKKTPAKKVTAKKAPTKKVKKGAAAAKKTSRLKKKKGAVKKSTTKRKSATAQIAKRKPR